MHGSSMMQRRPRVRNERHLRFVREMPCIICGFVPCEAAHIKMADARISKPITGNQTKSDDKYTLSLCRRHHEEQHSMSERYFWASYHIDAILIALALFSVSGDHQEGERLIINAMAARQTLEEA